MLTLMSKTRQAATARFSPGAVAIGMALTVLSSPASAFDADQLVRTAWEGFKTACGQAVTDPQGYLNAAPGLAPAGTRPVAGSPDGRVVTATIMRNNAEERVQFLGFSDRMVVFCHISSLDSVMQSAMPDNLAEKLLTNPELMNDPSFLAQMQREMSQAVMLDLRAADTALGTALALIVTQDPEATIVGGEIPMTPVYEYLGFPYGQSNGVAQQNYHGFGIETRFGDVAVHAIAEVQHGSLWIGLNHSIEGGQ